MSWVWLIIAGVFEIAWAIGLKYTDGFTRPLPTVLVIVALVISMGLLGLAVRDIPIGTAYAVWTGIGVVGTAVGGIWLFDESRDWVRLLCVSLIVIGIVGLKLTHRAAGPEPTPPADAAAE